MKDNKEILFVDTTWCIWCWTCMWICPDLFEFNKNYKSVVKKQPENEQEIDCAKQAGEVCPVMAIHLKY